jgi:tetratricopeptide (TPR) repeat protein
MTPKANMKKPAPEDPRMTQALQAYEAGVRAMQERKFDKARTAFEKVVGGSVAYLADRARVGLLACSRQTDRPAGQQFKTSEEHFDYAVSLINAGDYIGAREHLEKIVKQNPRSDFAIYGLAALECLTGHVEESLKRLEEALRIKPALRFQARNDSDFQNLAEDPRFTELLYPDPDELNDGSSGSFGS